MEKIFVDLLPNWVETNLQPAFYDLESGTVLQMVARMYPKVQELNKAFNDFSEENVEVVNNYINAFNELHDYVEDYFDNLDVQEEINNKLDDMVDAGTLQEIIASYLNSKAVFGFDTVADMKSSENLINGSYARTLGYYSKNDGGSALYKIRTITNDDVVDEMTIIEMENSDNLIAEYVEESVINVLQFGIKNDESEGISDKLNAILDIFKGKAIYLPKGTYSVNKTIYIDAHTTLYGENTLSTTLKATSAINMIELKDSFSKGVCIHDIRLHGNNTALIGISLSKSEYSLETVDMQLNLYNLNVRNFNTWCLKIGGDSGYVLADCHYDNITCEQFNGGGIYLTYRCTDSFFNNIRVGGGNVASEHNIVVKGYNLHFNNCKSFYSGTEASPKCGWYFEGSSCIYGDIEAQDTSDYGVNIKSCNAINLNIMCDRCTLASDNKPAIKIDDSHYMHIKTTISNYESSTQFGSDKGIAMTNSYNSKVDVVTTQPTGHTLDMVNNNNCYAIDYCLNGYDHVDVTPSFNSLNTSLNGITIKSVGNNQYLVSGTATAQTDFDLLGNYGASTVLTRIPANTVAEFTTGNYDKKVYLQLFNVTAVLSSGFNTILNNDAETNITGIKIRIPANTTIDTILSPRIIVTKNNN